MIINNLDKFLSKPVCIQVHQSPDNHTMINHTTQLFTQNQPEQNGLLCIKFALIITQLVITLICTVFRRQKQQLITGL